MNFIRCISLFITIFNCSLALSHSIPKSITVCGDGAEWPPYIYWKRDAFGQKTNKIIGKTVNILKEALAKYNINVTFMLPPWKRCLGMVKKGNLFSIALGASYSKKRARNFIVTDYYYKLTPYLYYKKSHYPDGFPPFTSSKQLLKIGNICGLYGYNYVNFLKGLKNAQVDTGAKNFKSLMLKLKHRRCVAFLARHEILIGFKKIGLNFKVGKELVRKKLGNKQSEKFYMLISRKIPYAHELKNLLNKEFKLIRNKY